jgi:hypothetical protein
MTRIRSRSSSLFMVTLLIAVTAAFLPLGTVGAASGTKTSASQTVKGKATKERVRLVRTVNVRQLITRTVAGQTGSSRLSVEAGHWADLEDERPEGNRTARSPSPSNDSVTVNENLNGWEGIDHVDQRFAGGGNQFSLEPPDQGLCVGGVSTNGPAEGPEVVESVNDALVFYDSTSHQFGVPITLSQFFGLPPEINRTTGEFGPFVTDPKCYFDPDTQRWFHTIAVISQDPETGDFEPPGIIYIAVSTSSEALGSYRVYAIDATDPEHPHCPCFADQPLIGADKYGFYVSTAEYDLGPFGGHFNGPQIYAMSKKGLETGRRTSVTHISGITHVVGDRTTGTVQPAMSQVGQFDTSNNGTEYFLSSFDCLADEACAVAPGDFDQTTIWALTNTGSLLGHHQHLQLSLQDMTVDTYNSPVPQVQKDGPRPLGEVDGESVPTVNANDSRMNQVVYADGYLWSGLNTAVLPGPRDGLEYFVVDPSASSGQVEGSIHSQGYVAARNSFLSFPSIGVNADGQGVIAFSLMGPNDYPSAAQIAIDASGTSGDIEIVRQGFRPEDGFTCYVTEVGPGALCRWGDYSASVGTPSGQIYSATELISDNSRSYYANWSTFVWPS